MANLSDVIDRLKAEGQLDRNTGTNSMKVQIGILKEIHESLHITGMAVKAIAAKITGEAVQDKQRAVQQGFEAQENTERQIENNNKNTSTLRKGLDGVKTAMSGTFGFLKDMFKTGLLGAALPLLFGALGGPAAMAIGAMTGNPFLILIGAIGTLTEMLASGDLMEILRDPDKTIGDKLAEIFYEGDNSLLGRIKKQIKEIYEELVPKETRDSLNKVLDDFERAIGTFKSSMAYVANLLGIDSPREVELRQTAEERIGRDPGRPIPIGGVAQFLRPQDLLTPDEAMQLVGRQAYRSILRDLGYTQEEAVSPMLGTLFPAVHNAVLRDFNAVLGAEQARGQAGLSMDAPTYNYPFTTIAPEMRPFIDLQSRIQEANALNQPLPSVFNQNTDMSQSTTVLNGQNPEPVDRFTGISYSDGQGI